MYGAACTLFYWSSMRRDVEKLVQGCEACQVYSPSRPREELLQHGDFLVQSMESVCMDLFYYCGGQYMHMMDNFSGFIWTRHFNAAPLTEKITDTLETIFNGSGYLEWIFTDGGPQMRALFLSWCTELGIQHTTSLAYFASSNGAIKILLLLAKQDLDQRGKLEDAVDLLNNLPVTVEGVSPARLFYDRPVRNP